MKICREFELNVTTGRSNRAFRTIIAFDCQLQLHSNFGFLKLVKNSCADFKSLSVVDRHRLSCLSFMLSLFSAVITILQIFCVFTMSGGDEGHFAREEIIRENYVVTFSMTMLTSKSHLTATLARTYLANSSEIFISALTAQCSAEKIN